MDAGAVVAVAAGVGVAVGLGIHFARTSKKNAAMAERIREELRGAESIALPDLVTRLGLPDGFMSRGKVMAVLNPMVAAGEVLQEEPPGTTVKDRLSVLRFRLKR